MGPRSSISVICCSQDALLSQKSRTVKVRMKVIVPSGRSSSPVQSTMKSESTQEMSMSDGALQLSMASAMPRATVVVSSAMSWSRVRTVSDGQKMTGAVSSKRAMYCSAMATLPQSSSAVQMRIQLPGQAPLSGQASIVMVRLSSQLSKASSGIWVGSSGSVSSSQGTVS